MASLLARGFTYCFRVFVIAKPDESASGAVAGVVKPPKGGMMVI
jgi:hypothetical protein